MQTALSSRANVPLPPVYVLPTKFISAPKNILDQNENSGILDLVSFKQCFENIYETDAHFVSNAVYVQGAIEPGPRLSKTIIHKVRQAGGDIMNTMLVLDYDNPGHGTWGDTPEQRFAARGAFLDQLAVLADSWAFAWEWTILYFTRGGARLVYVFDKVCDVESFELKHQWVCLEFAKRGMGGSVVEAGGKIKNWGIDCAVSDWTRCFRLPYVTRDKVMTWEEDYADIYFQYDNFINPDLIPQAEVMKRTNEYGEVKVYDSEMPDFDYAKSLCEFRDDHGNFKQTDWFKESKKRLRGRECYDCLFSHKKLADHGQRNVTLHKYVGQSVSLLFYLDGTEPAHIFGLFLPVVEQLDGDTDETTLWDHIQRLWAKEEAKDIKTKEVEIEHSKEAQSSFQRVVHGMRAWCYHPEIQTNDEAISLSFAARRLIVSCGHAFYIMGKNGWYDPIQLNKDQVIARIRVLGLDGVIETKVIGADGGYRDITVTELLNSYSTCVKEIKAVAEIEGAYIENLDTPNAALVVPSYRRNKELAPTYSEDVDQWLRRFFGVNYELGIKWIGWALAWDQGCICGLSLEGRAGSGKKLLVQGLAECLELPGTAGAEDLVGDYQYGLLTSPFLAVNEGWPTGKGARHPADSFRAMVSADPLRCNAKFAAPIVARNPVRVIFTANNLEVVKQLSGNRDLSPEDREALAIRLLHLRIDDQASDWLRMRGGTKFTAKPGERWISGDAGEKSDFVLAKHFLWLYQTRKGPCGSRFLVEGNNDAEVMFDMRTQSGASPIVIETLLHLLDKKPQPSGVQLVDGELYCATADVLSHHREEYADTTREKLTISHVSKVFKSISKHVPVQAFVIEGKESAGRKRWHKIDCELLLRVAERDGWRSSRLEAIVAEQRARTNGTYTPGSARAEDVAGETRSARIIDFGQSARNVFTMPS